MTATRKVRARLLVAEQMADHRTARGAGDVASAWTALERAHIISQPYLGLHLANHRAMLGFAVELHDWREAIGQVIRFALAPLGALTGRIPIGNTGRATVSAFQPMPIPDDLHAKIDGVAE